MPLQPKAYDTMTLISFSRKFSEILGIKLKNISLYHIHQSLENSKKWFKLQKQNIT